MHILLLTFSIAFFGALSIRAEYQNTHRWQLYIFKPLTTGLIIFTAATVPNEIASSYRYFIIAGLTFSLFGDIFLMLPSDKFIQGLVSFLVAHLLYIYAFYSETAGGVNLLLTLPLILFGLVFFFFLEPTLGHLKIPVAVYTLAILIMVFFALNRWLGNELPSGFFAAIGALLFAISDSLLAFDRFKTKFSRAKFFVLTTYFTAQWFIAISVTAGALIVG